MDSAERAEGYCRAPVIVAFSGGIGSGKSSVSKLVAELIGWPRVSCGDYVRSVAMSRGLGLERGDLQLLGAELMADPTAFCKGVLDQANWEPGKSLLIDGIRHAEALDAIKVLVSPATTKSVFLGASSARRTEQTGIENMEELDSHSTELQVSDLEHTADFVLDASQDPVSLAEQTATWIASQDAV